MRTGKARTEETLQQAQDKQSVTGREMEGKRRRSEEQKRKKYHNRRGVKGGSRHAEPYSRLDAGSSQPTQSDSPVQRWRILSRSASHKHAGESSSEDTLAEKETQNIQTMC